MNKMPERVRVYQTAQNQLLLVPSGVSDSVEYLRADLVPGEEDAEVLAYEKYPGDADFWRGCRQGYAAGLRRGK